ncbi:MAG: helix-hairpin-helix domain-containing protein, partial [Bacteroidales bacterium]|nr:helix-hairpin-helix domain-containing protein [Bacteroidales bacterium]
MFKDLLTLSRKEQRGLLVLVVLLGLMMLLRIGLPYLYPPVDFSQLVTDSIFSYWRTPVASPAIALDIKGLKAFDPNKVDAEQLVTYGLDPITASNWVKYLKAGGHFSSPGDIAKVYGMSEEWVTAVTPFITIPKSKSDAYGVNRELEKSIFLDLNRLDSISLRVLEWPTQMVDSVL